LGEQRLSIFRRPERKKIISLQSPTYVCKRFRSRIAEWKQVNLIAAPYTSHRCSWFNRLRETNVWAALSPDEQIKLKERERKNTYSQTSRFETPEELQLHHNHEKFLFLTVLLFFAQ
jgi:hypothetical protein